MFKKREYTIEKISIIFQVIVSLACFTFVWWFGTSPSEVQIKSGVELKNSMIAMALLWFLLISLFGLGKIGQRLSFISLFVSYFKLILIGVAFLYAVNIIFSYSALGIKNLLLFSAFNLFALIAYKYSFFTVMRFIFKIRGYNIRQILVIADEGSSEYIEKIVQTKDWRYNIRGIMIDNMNTELKHRKGIKIIPASRKLEEVFLEETIDEVIYCKTNNNKDEITSYISNCAEVGVSFHHYAEMISKENGIPIRNAVFSLIDQLPLITYKNTPEHYLELKLKNAFDFFFSLFTIILTSPVFLIIAIAIKLEGGGPIFFKQERVGLNGRRFLCFKFRTMVIGSEALQASLLGQNEQDGPVFKIALDPRVTQIGRFLRQTSLDELPQFLNVLRGEMSVVGPRPPIPLEVTKYQRWQKRRLSMKPGITCIWQVSGRNSIPFEQWMKLDLDYIDHWSLTRDFILVLKTIKVIITANGR